MFRTDQKYPHMRMLRSHDDILADILRMTARAGESGEYMTRLKQKSNLSDCAFKRHLAVLLDLGLLSSKFADDSRDFRKTYHLTSIGRNFLSIYEELVALLFSYWREGKERQVRNKEELVRAW
jgi:predicted transcriptional regulator